MSIIPAKPSPLALASARDVAERAARASFATGFDCLDKPERAQVLASIDPTSRAVIEVAEAESPMIEAAARQIAAGEERGAAGFELVDTVAQARAARDAEEMKARETEGPAAMALRIARGEAPSSPSDIIARRIAGLGSDGA